MDHRNGHNPKDSITATKQSTKKSRVYFAYYILRFCHTGYMWRGEIARRISSSVSLQSYYCWILVLNYTFQCVICHIKRLPKVDRYWNFYKRSPKVTEYIKSSAYALTLVNPTGNGVISVIQQMCTVMTKWDEPPRLYVLNTLEI